MRNIITCKIIFLSLLISFIVISYKPSWAKGKRLLLVAHNTTFLPEIENILSNMRNYKTNEPLFSNIINVNTWSINRLEVGDLDDLVRFYESSPQLRRKSKFALQADESLTKFIKQADCYIRIDVLQKLSLLEFQLIITDSLPKIEFDKFPILVTHQSRYRGFIIDISQKDYLQQLEISLKKLFPISNRPPIPMVKLNKEPNLDGFYYFVQGRTITFDATDSYDLDSPWELLTFRWRQLNPDSNIKSLRDENILPINPFSNRQEIIFNNLGEYYFGLTVSDGIVQSEEKVIKIKVVKPPYFSGEFQHSILDIGFFSKNKFEIPFTINTPRPDISSPKLISIHNKLTTSLIFKKFEKEIEDTNGVYIKFLSKKWDNFNNIQNYQLMKSKRGFDGQYRFRLVAQTNKVNSDTISILVNYKKKRFHIRPNFMNISFYQVKEDNKTQIENRTLVFRPSCRFYITKDLNTEFGVVLPLFKEKNKNCLNIYRIPKNYFSIKYSAWFLSYYFNGNPLIFHNKNLGYGEGMQIRIPFLPFSIEHIKYSHPEYHSINLNTEFEFRSDWSGAILGISGVFLFFYLTSIIWVRYAIGI
ncbi:MAG: hypothetical protein ACFFDN_32880 [Candidatus Hodarchaeota archaeon]